MPTLGRYELLRPLARGGMAEVFLARRRVGGVEKRLVVKRLRRDHQRDPRFLEMFVREAQLSMSLVHQNIVPVFDFGRIGDDVFIAMELIEGKDLGSTLARDRTQGMPPLLAAFVAHECCEALDHAHSRPDGVTHRDVTPRNVLLSWAGEVKLADFGIAAVVGEVAGSFGTPGYMAPEQARGERVDARADVYALGIVLWEALIGRHVRPAGERLVTLEAARSGELPALTDTIPPELAAIVRRATARDPAERTASARAMAEALDAYIVLERARAGGPAPSKQLAEWLRARWGDDREETGPIDTPFPDGGFVTFLDDGAEEVAGGHTQRSMEETAAAEEPKPPPNETPARPAVIADTRRVATQAATSRARRFALAGVAIAVVGVIGYVVTRDGHATIAPADAPAARPDAAIDARADAALDARPDAAIDAPAAIDVAVDAPADARVPVDARAPGAPIDAPRAPLDAARVVRDAPPAVLRPIGINAIPWAHFTVDDSPTQYDTPVTLQLAVGKHRITFSNPELGVSRTVTVEVPAEGPARHIEKMN